MNFATVLASRSYRELKSYVLDHTGLSYYSERDEDLATRVARRLQDRSITDLSAYLDLVRSDSEELDCLVGELTIGETYFFRQIEHFELLRNEILPALLHRNALQRRIRIWSAGCATGAEPYSIEILLRTEFGPALEGWDVSITGTDINVEFLAKARQGLFPEWALRETPAHIKAECFRPEGKAWRLLPVYRERVNFHYHNLMAPTKPSPDGDLFDVILCRNVLIYFSAESIRKVVHKLYDSLTWNGTLLVGHAEPNPETFSSFEHVSAPGATWYRKTPEGNAGKRLPAMRRELTRTPPEITPPPDGFSPLRPERPERTESVQPAVPKPTPAPVTAATPESTEQELRVEEVRALADRGDWESAHEAASSLVSTSPLNAEAHFTLGMILEHTGDQDGARDAFRRAIYLDRGLVLAHYHLGTSLQISGNPVSAGRALRATLRLLDGKAPGEPLPHGDGITAHELANLARMHLELIPHE